MKRLVEESQQCDQMARFFIQYLAINNGEKLPKSIKNLPKKVHKLSKY